jgi:bifunctional DNA-binding transcriptional regulator/antitoxin component of YhaV-PrlF toxin-antitoxin module
MTARARVDQDGRLTIPRDLLAAAGIEPDSDVVLDVRQGELRLRRAATALTEVQQKYRALAPGRDMVDELIADRRNEVARE